MRTKPCCCGCGRAAPSQAAHIRIGLLGMQIKPHDRNAVPLNQWCHLDAPDAQHKDERGFWDRRGKDPFEIAATLYAEYGGSGGKVRKRRTTIRPRLPKEKRAKIPSRPFPKRRMTP